MKQQSKFLSLVLRHKPEVIGLTLDQQGWVSVETLLTQLAAHDRAISREMLDTIVATSDKKRFTLSDDGARIRAAQGHSVNVALGLAPTIPPAVLYHGTAEKNLDPIMTDGLCPRTRQQVHLSADTQTAKMVGIRHGKPIVLNVDAAKMQADGLVFFQAENGVWLTDHVPPQYLTDEKDTVS